MDREEVLAAKDRLATILLRAIDNGNAAVVYTKDKGHERWWLQLDRFSISADERTLLHRLSDERT